MAARLHDRRGRYKAMYGITLEQLEKLQASKKGLCWICESRPAKAVDHCHKTNRVRGVVCNSCNYFLGLIEIPNRLERALKYLKDSHADVLLKIANE